MEVSFYGNIQEFVWDAGNRNKNFLKHGVTNQECEEVFLKQNYILLDDLAHSAQERRRIVIGPTNKGKILSIAFTIRNNRIRVISARGASKRERTMYEETIEAA